MRKQSGFTLIELMVVMAIIAILATAGLSAYTGYIKKARDATRIADIRAIESIVMASLGTTGKPPQTTADLHDLIEAINNGKGIYDPLSSQTDGANHKYICQVGTTTSEPCYYTYRLCDGGMGFAVGGWFESTSNQQLYVNDPIDEAGTPNFYGTPTDDQIYEVGSCKIFCPTNGTVSGCPSLGDPNNLPTKIDDAGTFVTT